MTGGGRHAANTRIAARLTGIPGFSIDAVAASAGTDPEMLRMENLDTDLPPPAAAIRATRAALRELSAGAANSYLPFTGSAALRRAVAARTERDTGHPCDPDRECVITAGGTEGMLNAILALTDPGDEVVVTDPTYAGMIQRIRLAGGVPRFVPWVPGQDAGWRLDTGALARETERPAVRALFIMNPSMPAGGLLDQEDWEVVRQACAGRGLWLIYNAAMERIVYGGRPVSRPAAVDGLRHRTVTVGSVSKEYRMIGWRTGWVTGPAAAIEAIARVGVYNVVTPVGIAQAAAAQVLSDPGEAADVRAAVGRWETRHEAVLDQLADWPVRAAAGGWSLLLDAAAMGMTAQQASRGLLDNGRVAATPMDAWGTGRAAGQLRLVFSNEPTSRLATLRERFRAAFG